jgi:hypothetical protein
MIRVLAKERFRHVDARRANPFDSNSRALFKNDEDALAPLSERHQLG